MLAMVCLCLSIHVIKIVVCKNKKNLRLKKVFSDFFSLYCEIVTIYKCIFTFCSFIPLFLRNFSERGGAINNDSDLEIVGCRFVGNVLRIMDDSSYTSNEQSFSSDLHGATFHNNRHIKLIDCDFPSIKSDVIDKWGDVTMVNCSFEDHETSDY